MGTEERRQDIWAVTVALRNGRGEEVAHRRGFVILLHPMTAFEAADRAVRIEVEHIGEGAGDPWTPRTIHAVVWGKREKGRHPGWVQQSGALAEYDADLGVFMRPKPWISDGGREAVKAPEGAEFLSADWH